MTRGVLIALTNPASPDREEAYNHWYNVVHGSEVTALRGFAAMTRFKAVAQAVPPAETPSFAYLAVYDLDDVDAAIQSLAENGDAFQMSDAVDLERALGIGFEQIFSTKDPIR